MRSERFVASFYFQMARGDQHDLTCQTIKSWEAWNLKLSLENCSGIQKSDEFYTLIDVNVQVLTFDTKQWQEAQITSDNADSP